jgi:4a-hydroxytetrahydrobiopterin dehydratase
MAKLSDAHVNEQLSRVPGWKHKGKAIQKVYPFADFQASITFVNRVAEIAERLDHHPDILVQYDKVTLTSSSHDSGGLTARDFRLAAEIDK